MQAVTTFSCRDVAGGGAAPLCIGAGGLMGAEAHASVLASALARSAAHEAAHEDALVSGLVRRPAHEAGS